MKIFLIALQIIFLVFDLYAYGISVANVENKGWVLLDDSNTPFIIRGVCYSPVPIGQNIYTYDIFSDDNRLWLTDAEYMEKMGVNAIRIYNSGKVPDDCKKFIRQMYRLFSINTVFPLPLPMQGIDYTAEEERERVKKKILETVKEFKDTPGIVVWLLGNEIDYFFYDQYSFWETEAMTNINSPFKRARMRGEVMFKFVNEIIAEIQAIDDMHPVGVSLGKTEFFNIIEDNLANADFIGLNYYQSRNFSSVWSFTKKIKMPILITEFGYDAYNTKKEKEDEKQQAKFIKSLWKDLYRNTFHKSSNAICLGGMIFEWTDEWWKYQYGDPHKHEIIGTWPNAAWLDFTPDKPNNVQEEWFGIFRISKSPHGIDNRTPRKIFYQLKKLWNPDFE